MRMPDFVPAWMRPASVDERATALHHAKYLREQTELTAVEEELPRWKLRLTWAAFGFLEVCLVLVASTDFTFTRSGLIVHGIEPTKATALAAVVGVAMVVFWTIVYHLMTLHNWRRWVLGLPLILALGFGSWFGGGQWILIDLAGVAAQKEAAGDLRRSVDAYLAPADRPGQTLATIESQISGVKRRFQAFLEAERKGAYSGMAGEGPATRATERLIGALEQGEQGMKTLQARWQDTLTRNREALLGLALRAEAQALPRAEVETTLQRVVADLGAFPFGDARTVAGSALNGAGEVVGMLPTKGKYAEVRTELTALVNTAVDQITALLASLNESHLGPQPQMKVQSVREVVYANPKDYLPDIAHALFLVLAPLIGALGPSQAILGALAAHSRAVRRRREREEAARDAEAEALRETEEPLDGEIISPSRG